MEVTPPPYAQTHKEQSRGTRLTIKGLIVGVLILLLLIPIAFITHLVDERKDRKAEVVREVSSKWATDQIVSGPYLLIPYKGAAKVNDKGVITGYEVDVLTLLPDQLNIEGEITPFSRHRSIFDVTVYQSALTIKGNFSAPGVPVQDMYLDGAKLMLGISDFRGIDEELAIVWDGRPIEMVADDSWQMGKKSGYEEDYDYDYKYGRSDYKSISTHGLAAPVKLSKEDLEKGHEFSIDLSLKGSQELNFVPLGKSTTVKLASSWETPSFIGAFLPDNPAEFTAEGFTAEWKVLYINRQYPQQWIGTSYNVDESIFGVKLLEKADSYAQTARSAKYAILFIALTLILYFFVEIFQKKRVHPLQYVMVGFALCLFYTLLLSISEYSTFGWAYLVASVATISLITLYTSSAFRSWKTAGIFGIVLTLLYTFIYVLVQLQDRALLYGSIGLFIILAALMYFSRKIDWYGQNQ